MKLDHYTKYLLRELGFSHMLVIDDPNCEEQGKRLIINWLDVCYKVKYELLEEYHDRLIRGGVWRNVHKFTIHTSPTSSHAWSSRDFDKALQRMLFELKSTKPNED